MLGDHFFLDLPKRKFFGGPFAMRLNQPAAHVSSHDAPPLFVKRVYSGRTRHDKDECSRELRKLPQLETWGTSLCARVELEMPRSRGDPLPLAHHFSLPEV